MDGAVSSRSNQVPAAETSPAAVAAAAVRRIEHVATLPEVAIGIMEIVEDPHASAQDLNDLIARDPALAARILKVVNSSFYGLPRQIGSINRAISMLGLNAVKNVAVAASLSRIFRGGTLGDRFSARDLWDHSIAAAAAARLVARQARRNCADEAFLAGLMHDVGVMVELQLDRTRLLEVFASLPADALGLPLADFRLAERTAFAADHCDFGAALAEQWKFPRPLVLACAHHHDPASAPSESREMPWIVHLADRLAAEHGGFRADLADLAIAPAALDCLGLDRADVDVVRGRLAAELESAAASLAA